MESGVDPASCSGLRQTQGDGAQLNGLELSRREMGKFGICLNALHIMSSTSIHLVQATEKLEKGVYYQQSCNHFCLF
jgi:hypothetical protein